MVPAGEAAAHSQPAAGQRQTDGLPVTAQRVQDGHPVGLLAECVSNRRSSLDSDQKSKLMMRRRSGYEENQSASPEDPAAPLGRRFCFDAP